MGMTGTVLAGRPAQNELLAFPAPTASPIESIGQARLARSAHSARFLPPHLDRSFPVDIVGRDMSGGGGFAKRPDAALAPRVDRRHRSDSIMKGDE